MKFFPTNLHLEMLTLIKHHNYWWSIRTVIVAKIFENSVDKKYCHVEDHSDEKGIFISFELENKIYSVEG